MQSDVWLAVVTGVIALQSFGIWRALAWIDMPRRGRAVFCAATAIYVIGFATAWSNWQIQRCWGW